MNHLFRLYHWITQLPSPSALRTQHSSLISRRGRQIGLAWVIPTRVFREVGASDWQYNRIIRSAGEADAGWTKVRYSPYACQLGLSPLPSAQSRSSLFLNQLFVSHHRGPSEFPIVALPSIFCELCFAVFSRYELF